MNGNLSLQQTLQTLAEGAIDVAGQFVWGSNYTFLVRVGMGETGFNAVYKPSRGEQPLWDFPPQSLAHREVAAYVISRELGWNLVPPTVLREDGPGGGGSLQFFVEADPERHYFTFRDSDKQRLRPAALFDVVINNADRKGGHIILGDDSHVWLIDHGVCFHEEYKLRTVIWDFAGEPIPSDLMQDLESLIRSFDPGQGLLAELQPLLNEGEIIAIRERLRRLLAAGRFPEAGAGRPYPWPLV